MKKADVYEVAFKVLGLYMLFPIVSSLRDLVLYISMMTFTRDMPGGSDIQEQYFLMLLSMALSLVLFIVLFFFFVFRASSLATRIAGKTGDENVPVLNWDKSILFQLAVFIIAGILLVWTLPDLCTRLYEMLKVAEEKNMVSPRDKSYLVSSIVKLVLALVGLIYFRPIGSRLAQGSGSGEKRTID